MPSDTPTTHTIDLSDATTFDGSDGTVLPPYDRTVLLPGIAHIGVGGFHRAHLATYVDDLARSGEVDWSITGIGLLPHDHNIAAALTAQDGLYSLITRSASASDVRVIGSIVDFIHADGSAEADRRVMETLASPQTRIVSLTITEGSYPVTDAGVYDPNAPSAGTRGAFGVIVEALRRRRADGIAPFTVLSCDNIVGNGDVARLSTLGTAAADPDLAKWIEEEGAFPNSMVDRITPVTTPADIEWLKTERGIIDQWPVVTEPFLQWVLEDVFACGRPPFENVGVLVTDDVEPYEILKLRMLNAGHSMLAYVAALLDVEHVHTAMSDPQLSEFFLAFVNREVIPVLPDAAGIDPVEYRDTLVERFSNPAIGDQISRLCLDGSSKFPKFLLPTIRLQLAAGGSVDLSALALAGWCRYLQGVSDSGAAIEPSFDPILDELVAAASRAKADPGEFLKVATVFGDLATNERFATAFTDQLRSLIDAGVRSTLTAALAEPE